MENSGCGVVAQQVCTLLLLFQMRIVRARATLTTGSKVRRGSPRARNPFPALAAGTHPPSSAHVVPTSPFGQRWRGNRQAG